MTIMISIKTSLTIIIIVIVIVMRNIFVSRALGLGNSQPTNQHTNSGDAPGPVEVSRSKQQ